MQLPREVPAQPRVGLLPSTVGLLSTLTDAVGVQGGDQTQPGLEEPLVQRLLTRPLGAGQVPAEIFEVPAEVEGVEVRLVPTRTEQVRAQPGAAAQHLPELRLRPHWLEEHQIGHLGHVDAGVEHVHRDRHMRRLLRDREVVDQALRVAGAVGDHPREMPRVLRVGDVEPRRDELRMTLVLGEDDRLGQPVTVGDLEPLVHHLGQHLIDGVLVEQEPVDLLRRHLVGGAVLTPLQDVPIVLLLLGQVGVFDALPQEPGAHLYPYRRDQEPLGHCVLQPVGVGGHPVLEVEQPVGVVIHLVLRGGGQPHQQRVEPGEDAAVLLVHRPVRLVDHHQVEVARPEHPCTRVDVVDQVHHRRIGRHVHPAVGVLLRQQIHRRGIGQVRLESVGSLQH